MPTVKEIMDEAGIVPKEFASAKDFLQRKAPEWNISPLTLLLNCRELEMGFADLYQHVKNIKEQMKEQDDEENEGNQILEDSEEESPEGDRYTSESSEIHTGTEGA